MTSPIPRYSRAAQAFHWLTALLALIAFISGPGGSETRIYSDANANALRLHETMGMLVFGVTLLRLLWRMADRTPDPVAMPDWMEKASKAVHWTLFGLLVLTPVTAVLAAWWGGHAIVPFRAQIAPMIGEAKTLGSLVAEIHGFLGDAILWIAGLHAAAAIYHHVWLRDDVLRRMTPFLKG